jgi:uncharacterized protein YcaQ
LKIPKDAARAFSVRKQGFDYSRTSVKKEHISRLLVALGCVQIDAINVVERSHYLAFWSRLGNYRKKLLDELLYPDRRVFEYWAHAASIIPFEEYRYFIPAMKKRRREIRRKAERSLKKDAGLLDTVLKQIKLSGPLSSKDFKHAYRGKKKERRTGWWDWKPAKYALELLFGAGILMVSRRENFQRYYDLAENVIPSHVDTSEPTEEERQLFFLTKTLDAWGVAEPKDISQYFYGWSIKADLGVKALSGLVRELEKEDVLTTVQVEDVESPYLILTKDLDNLERTLDMQEQVSAVSLISPFDNLTWSKPRIRKLFGFHSDLEIYVPKETRRFGYYTLNILFNDQVVGRLDPKMHRDKGTLEIRALELEDGFAVKEDFMDQLVSALMDFMRFLGAQDCIIGENCPSFLKTLNRLSV